MDLHRLFEHPITDEPRVLANSTISLSEGLNVIKIRVTAADTVTTRTYTLNIVRPYSAPVQDANALMTSYLTPTANTRYKGFYALSGGTSGWMSHRWVQKAQADGIGARIRIDALMSVDNAFTSGDGQRFRANTITVCFIPSAEIETGLRLEIGGRAFWLAEGRHHRRGAQCWEWDRPADMNWSLGERVTVSVFNDGALSGGPNHPPQGEITFRTFSQRALVGDPFEALLDNVTDEDGLTLASQIVTDIDGIESPRYPRYGFTYQWLEVNGELEDEIADETSAVYFALTADNAGKTLKVRVSFRDDRGFSETITSAPITIETGTYNDARIRDNEEVLWAGVLTPTSTTGTYVGCSDRRGTSKACDNAAVLRETAGSQGKYSGDINELEFRPNAVKDMVISFDSMVGRTADQIVNSGVHLIIGGKRLPFDHHKTGIGEFAWPNTGIELVAGTPVDVKIVGPGVTGTLEQGPAWSEGAGRQIFRFDLKFNKTVTISAEDLKDHGLNITNGSLRSVTQLGSETGRYWVIQVHGRGTTPTTVEVTPKDCDQPGAICTPAGAPLVEKLTAVTENPVVLAASIANASGEEDDGYIDFPVTLTRKSDFLIEIDYRTHVIANEAEEGQDFYPAKDVEDGHPWVVFAPGETEQTIRVRLINDLVPDSGETFNVALIRWRAVDVTGRRKNKVKMGVVTGGTAEGTILNHEAIGTMGDADDAADTPTTGPTATFINVPEAHGGEAFTFTVAFGEEFGMTAEALKNAFQVTNGSITTLERVEEYIFRNWSVTVTPSGTEDVTIALNQAEDCAAALALCTEDGRAIAESVTVEVPETAAPPVATTPLTATFGDVPVNHAGSEFTLQLSLSEEPKSDFTYRTFAGGAGHTSVLEVTNGTVTRASRVEGNRVWQLRIQPDTDADEVTVALPATTDCAATGAICTDDARALSNAPSVTVPKDAPVQATPLTVRFGTAMPTEHDGTSPFTFRIAFSENLDGYSYKTLRDASLTVMQGAVRLTPTKVSRVYRNDPSRVNQAWNVEVTPRSKEDISIELGPGPACGSAGAMCTEDGRALSNTITSTVHGPPGLSVADAEATEGPGATLDFVVSMSRASAHTVTVDYATGEGTASADDDYTSAAGTLTFDTGQTEKTVSIGVVNDGHDDDGETMTLALSNAQGGNAYLTDSEATGTIRNTDAMPNAWLARFGRTVADQVIEAAEGRFTQGRSPGLRMSLAGYNLGGSGLGEPEAPGQHRADAQAQSVSEWFDDAASEERDHGLGEQSISLQDVLMSSRLSATAGSADGGFASVWAHGTQSWFDGRDGDTTITGDVKSGMLGADVTRDDTIAGLMLVLSSGEGEYYGEGEGEGQVESTLTGVYPYARHRLNAQLSVWGAAGYGEGSLTLTPAGQDPIKTDMDLMMGALGVRGIAREAPHEGGIEIALTSDAMAVRTSSERTTGLSEAKADVTRLRLGMENTWRGLAHGAVTPRLELGVRHDAGDAETGVGADIGAGMAWRSAAYGLSGDVSVRGLLTHEADGFREHGIAGNLAWDPRPESSRGFSATMHQTIGATTSGGTQALFGQPTMADIAGGGDAADARHLEIVFGYGFGMLEDRFTSTPQARVAFSEHHRETTVGWRLNRERGNAGSVELGLEATRREATSGEADPENALMLRLQARF